MSCLKCKKEGVTAEYVGQSARTGQRRGCEHLEDLRGKKNGKPLWDHSLESHGGDTKESDYKMKVLKRYRTPLERQIGEALEIERRGWSADILMNKKDEYNSIRMPRLRLESVEEVVEAEPNQEGEGKQEARERIQRLRRDYTRQKASKRKVGEENSESDDDRSDRMVTEGPKKRLKLLEQDTSSGGKIGSKDNFTTIIDKNEEKET